MSENFQEPSEDQQEEPSEDQQEEPSEMLQEEPSEMMQEEPSEERQEEPSEERQEEPPEPDMPVFEWYIQVADGKKAGPISFERLRSFAERGKIFPKTKVRSTEADSVWTPAGAMPELFPGIDPEKYAEPEKPGKPDAEESSSGSVAVSDDSQAVTKPKVLIDLGRKKDEKPAKKPKEKKASAFVIDTDASSAKKKEENPVEKSRKTELVREQTNEEDDGSTVISSPGIKISIGTPAGKRRTDGKKADNSAVVKANSEPKKRDKKEKEEPVDSEPAKKKRGASLLGIRIAGILSALLGTLGGIGLGYLSLETAGYAFGMTLAVVLAFFGISSCLAFWLIASLYAKISEQNPRELEE